MKMGYLCVSICAWLQVLLLLSLQNQPIIRGKTRLPFNSPLSPPPPSLPSQHLLSFIKWSLVLLPSLVVERATQNVKKQKNKSRKMNARFA